MAGHGNLDVHDRRNGAVLILVPLIDANAATGQAAENPLKAGDVIADRVFGAFRRIDMMKGDFEGYLHGAPPDCCFRDNAVPPQLVAAARGSARLI
jgi:hypothetical protein